MRVFVCAALLLLSLGAALPNLSGQTTDADAIDRLVKQLSSQRFAEREKAQKQLDAIGLPAYEALKKAAETGDPETKRRAGELLVKLDRLVLSRKILAPTRIKLSFEDALLNDAVEELSKKSDCKIKLVDPENKLKDRRVTLQTGETTFWEVLDQFCAKAGLVESEPEISAPGQPPADQAVWGHLPNSRAPHPAPIVLKVGTSKQEPTSYAGAVRLKAMDSVQRFGPVKDRELLAGLALTLESKIRWQEVIHVRIDKAVDDQGQTLLPGASALGGAAPREQPNVPGGGGVIILGGIGNGVGNGNRGTASGLYQYVPVRLTREEKPSKSLKELTGVLTVQVLAEPEIQIIADDILKSSGKTFKGKEGGFIKVESAEQKDARLMLKVELDRPAGAAMQGGNGGPIVIQGGGGGRIVIQGGGRVIIGGRVIQGGGTDDQGLELLDEKDNVVPKLSGTSQTQIMAGGVQTLHNLTFDLKEGQKPAKLVFKGSKSVAIEVPFTLKDVKLP